ncbi:MAG: hypothetical protein K0R38_3800 [Polyangiaceae bacterium]|nr:hypothetical protein [Polyangiaceae bacterium]
MRLLAMCALGVLAGCSAARDVEINGQVTAPKELAVGSALVIDFIDVVGAGKGARRTAVERVALDGLGEFRARVMLEGDQVLVRVIDDRNLDGECSFGEAWGEAHAPVGEDSATDVSLMLGTKVCP